MNNVLVTLAVNAIGQVIDHILTEENIKKYGGRLFDLIEDVVVDSETKIDDMTVLPVIRALRIGLDL